MKNMIFSTIVGGINLALCGTAGVVTAAVIGQVPSISSSSNVSIELVAGLVVAGISSAMWLSSRMTKLVDSQLKLTEGQARLEKGQERMQDKFDQLPCRRWPVETKNMPPCKDEL